MTSESVALHGIPDPRAIAVVGQNSMSGYDTPNESGLMTPKVEQDMLNLMEDSLDGGPPSVGSGDIPAQSPLPNMSTPLSGNKKVRFYIFIKNWNLTVIFRSQCRKIRRKIRQSWSQVTSYIQVRSGREFVLLIRKLALAKLAEWSEMRWVFVELIEMIGILKW